MGQIYLASGSSCSEEHTTTGVLVDPSAADWVCVIQDSSGNTVFSARGNTATAFYAPVKITADAFNITTATNLTGVVLYT